MIITFYFKTFQLEEYHDSPAGEDDDDDDGGLAVQGGKFRMEVID